MNINIDFTFVSTLSHFSPGVAIPNSPGAGGADLEHDEPAVLRKQRLVHVTHRPRAPADPERGFERVGPHAGGQHLLLAAEQGHRDHHACAASRDPWRSSSVPSPRGMTSLILLG